MLQRGPRDPERGPPRGAGGASRTAACGVRRPWRRGGCSGRSPSLGTPLPGTPRKHPLEKDFPEDFLARGRAECREAKTLPGRRDCPGQGRCRPPDRPTAPTAWQLVGSVWKGDCHADSASPANLGEPSPSTVKLSHTRAPLPGHERQEKAQNTAGGGEPLPVSPSERFRLP